jgi:hypothetical protein
MFDYRLHIKGNMATARAEITRRLGARAVVGISEYHKAYDSTYAVVCIPKTSMTVYSWFNESPPITMGTGYPSGTLLHFNVSN